MWKDICIMNRDHLVKMIDRYISSLNQFKREIIAGDEPRLEKHLRSSSDVRKRLD
jgi:prephenate dehydrogenase